MKLIAQILRHHPTGQPFEIKAHSALVQLDENGEVESLVIRFAEQFLIVAPKRVLGSNYFKGGDCVNPVLEIEQPINDAEG